jgi:type II restriction/modification system DNA methylase subunit YeeA
MSLRIAADTRITYTFASIPLSEKAAMSPLTPHEFVQKWRGDTRKERSVSQEHFIDLCRLIDHETPGDNRDGTLVFEAGVGKSGGGQGWADVWKRGIFGWEYKGPRADLGKAYQQLQQYRDSLENPPLLVVSDIQTIVVHSNFVNTIKQVTTLTLDDLLTPAGLQTLRDIFTHPEALRPATTIQQVTEQAATEFAKLADLLRKYGEEPQASAHFLIRLLFCLFAEDIGLLPTGLFTKIITATRHKAPAFAAQVKDLFGKMATGGYFGADEIKHFNGGLFDNDSALPLDSDGLAILERVSALDWSSIEPSIFGTLFERSLDPSKRAQLGAHYTSRDDILLIVEPVLMLPLRRRWTTVEAEARALAAQRDAASGPRRNKLQLDLQRKLQDFASEIAGTRVLDPACGSGNFLYVSLKQLLDLEKQVINLGADLGLTRMIPIVGPEQLLGIEVNELAHELAQVTVWIGYIQWLKDNGFGEPSQPILQSLETITHMDAILAFDEAGDPIEPAWPEADVVIGNPPFLGGKRLRTELGSTYVDHIFALYDERVPREADLVTYWFERARALIEQGEVQRAGLLATQAIRGGANRKVLEQIKQSGDIFMAWADRKWILNGAAVQVSMIGFDAGEEAVRELDGAAVQCINVNLTSDLDLTKAQRLIENSRIAFMGDTKGGAFDLTPDQVVPMLNAPLNHNGRPNTDVVVPWVNGLDITRRSRGMFIIDFGVDMPEGEAALYELPFAHIEHKVKPERMKNNRAAYRERWWIHVEPRPALRTALKPLQRYIGTPRLTKHRLFVYLNSQTLPDSQVIAIVRDDDYFFGVLHSKAHELWARAMGTQLREAESGFRYTPSTCFETFPFPWASSHEPQGHPHIEAIAAAAKRLVELRDAWLNEAGLSEAELKKRTLTNLYNQRPPWLVETHRQLDAAVLAAYGWPADLGDDEILAGLLALNLERAAQQGAAQVAEAPEADYSE